MEYSFTRTFIIDKPYNSYDYFDCFIWIRTWRSINSNLCLYSFNLYLYTRRQLKKDEKKLSKIYSGASPETKFSCPSLVSGIFSSNGGGILFDRRRFNVYSDIYWCNSYLTFIFN